MFYLLFIYFLFIFYFIFVWFLFNLLNFSFSENAYTFEKNKENERNSCTFKPEIFSKKILPKKDNENDSQEKENRLDQMYNIGKNILKNRKDKPRKDFEIIDEKECYFKPDMSK